MTKGLYSVLLGDTSVPGMTQPIPSSVWTNPDVRLRVWFSDGTNGFQQLTPDQRLAPNGYLPDGAVSSTAISSGAITSEKIAGGAVGGTQLAPGLTLGGTTLGTFSGNGGALSGLTATNIASGTLADARLSANVALRSGGNSFSGDQNITNGVLRIGDSDFLLRGGIDPNHGLGWYGAAKPFADVGVDGPVLYGYGGGALGSTDLGNPFFPSRQIALRWTAYGYVGIGTSNPASQLHLSTAGHTELSIESTETSSLGAIIGRRWSLQSTGSGSPLQLQGSFQLIDRTVGAARLVVLGDGRVGIGTNNPVAKLDVEGSIAFPAFTSLLDTGRGAPRANSDNGTIGYMRFSQGLDIIGAGTTAANRKITLWGDVSIDREITCVAINITSDRNAKEDFKPVNAREVLDKVARLPISEWQYKEHADARHIGPMAQNFREAFALGHDEKHITSVDADGVALAAIQGLNEKLDEQGRDKDARIKELEKSVGELKNLVEQLARQSSQGKPE